jgi:hypothetical protein
VRVFVEFDIGEVQPPSTELVDVPAGATTQDDTKAGYYLFEAEWFGDVVVGTEGEAADLIVQRVACGQEQYCGVDALSAQPAQHIEAVDAGQRDVEDYRVGAYLAGLVQRGGGTTISSNKLNPLTIKDILVAIGKAGLAVPNPRDLTQRDCPEIGCENKEETDAVSIIKFPTPGKAQLYAGSTEHAFQIEDVVMTFTSLVSTNEQLAYEEAVKRAIE